VLQSQRFCHAALAEDQNIVKQEFRMSSRYAASQIAVHWLMAIGVILLLINGKMVLADLPNTIEKVGNLRIHILIGGLVGALVISRFILRRRRPTPPPAASSVRLIRAGSRETGGTGLGLAIANQIARAHGGDVTLRNRSGSGFKAEISLSRNVASV